MLTPLASLDEILVGNETIFELPSLLFAVHPFVNIKTSSSWKIFCELPSSYVLITYTKNTVNNSTIKYAIFSFWVLNNFISSPRIYHAIDVKIILHFL